MFIVKVKIKMIFCLFFILLTNISLWAETNEIPIYTYHTHAPFIIANKKGLSYDLADYLSVQSGGKYRFNVIPMSRARVNKMLEQKEEGIIPWINPAWFSDQDKNRYLWTDAILMEDGNSVISRESKDWEYNGPDSVTDFKFGGIRGHQYVDIDDLVEKEIIVRVDAENHIDNFRKLTKDRIDFTITPTTGALYLLKVNNLLEDLFISPYAHSTYTRECIIADESQEMKAFLDTAILKMRNDPIWQDILSAYK